MSNRFAMGDRVVCAPRDAVVSKRSGKELVPAKPQRRGTIVSPIAGRPGTYSVRTEGQAASDGTEWLTESELSFDHDA